MKRTLFVLPFLLLGCDKSEIDTGPTSPTKELAWQYGLYNNLITSNVSYVYDRKTDLCYAVWAGNLGSITNVPCKVDVIAEIKREYYAH